MSHNEFYHDHTFGQDVKKTGEHRTYIVIVITLITMLVEIAAGILFGSMALLADGFHMASHASALTISAFAYSYTRKHARDERFSFGTGKVNSLAGFASAVMLALFALLMAWESVERFLNPVDISFNQAIFVAVLGLIVNGISLIILGGHGHSHGDHDHTHGHHDHDHSHSHHHMHKDHNLWSAYIHVLADALTSLLAIFALLAGKYYGLNWLDPFMGIVGAILVIRWAMGLLRGSAQVLLDMQAPEKVRQNITDSIESDGNSKVADLHVWAIGPGIFAAKIVISSSNPLSVEKYHNLVNNPSVVHKVIEIRKSSL